MFDTYLADILPLYLKCLATGRPPNFTPAYVDCRFPESENANEKGVTDLNAACMWSCALFAIDSPFLFFSLNLPVVETWNYRFAAECVAEVAARTLAAEIPSYATIMELDRKVRDFPIPEYAAHAASLVAGPVPTIATEELLSSSDSTRRFTMIYTREVRKSRSFSTPDNRSRIVVSPPVLLYIHRSFFAQAVMENPDNPLKSRYAPSFLAAYRASSTILRTIGAQYTRFPDLCARTWTIWMYGFSAAVRRSYIA